MDLFVIIGRCEISISFGSFAHIETDLFINGQTLYEYVQINIDVQSNSVIDNILNAHKNSGVILLFKFSF